ncbi:hypothetical protein ZIOFF_070150 [Zingiber officinale]|uniref:Uncharacterized protein n=1 Tax=Zingiber officinale TaxID=94328 RepID=A0A8J5C541_ZINOF|nr:hypothetical protein ZIOFF_070150 [Zingiber officinale]
MLITLCLYPIPILVFFPISFSPVPLPTCDFQGFGHISNRRWRRDMRRPLDLRPWIVGVRPHRLDLLPGRDQAVGGAEERAVQALRHGLDAPVLPQESVAPTRAEIRHRQVRKPVGLAVANRRLPLQLKKKPKIMQQHLDYCFPGLWLSKITPRSYKANE